MSLLLIATGCRAPLLAQRPSPFGVPDVQAGRLRVRVVDTTGVALQAAMVYVTELNIGAVTNDVGIATLALPTRGRVVVRVLTIGYKASADTIVFMPERGFSATVVLIAQINDLLPISCCDGEGSSYGRPWRPDAALASSPPEPAAPLMVPVRSLPVVPPVTMPHAASKLVATPASDATGRPIQFGVMLGLEQFTLAQPQIDKGVGLAVDALMQAPLPPRRLGVRF